MERICIVRGCCSNGYLNQTPNPGFRWKVHNFPKNPDERKLWISKFPYAICYEEITDTTGICSLHWSKDINYDADKSVQAVPPNTFPNPNESVLFYKQTYLYHQDQQEKNCQQNENFLQENQQQQEEEEEEEEEKKTLNPHSHSRSKCIAFNSETLNNLLKKESSFYIDENGILSISAPIPSIVTHKDLLHSDSTSLHFKSVQHRITLTDRSQGTVNQSNSISKLTTYSSTTSSNTDSEIDKPSNSNPFAKNGSDITLPQNNNHDVNNSFNDRPNEGSSSIVNPDLFYVKTFHREFLTKLRQYGFCSKRQQKKEYFLFSYDQNGPAHLFQIYFYLLTKYRSDVLRIKYTGYKNQECTQHPVFKTYLNTWSHLDSILQYYAHGDVSVENVVKPEILDKRDAYGSSFMQVMLPLDWQEDFDIMQDDMDEDDEDLSHNIDDEDYADGYEEMLQNQHNNDSFTTSQNQLVDLESDEEETEEEEEDGNAYYWCEACDLVFSDRKTQKVHNRIKHSV